MNDGPQELCRIGHSLFERGYVHATAGNISVRLPDGAEGRARLLPLDLPPRVNPYNAVVQQAVIPRQRTTCRVGRDLPLGYFCTVTPP